MKQVLRCGVIIPLLIGLIGMPVFAQEMSTYPSSATIRPVLPTSAPSHTVPHPGYYGHAPRYSTVPPAGMPDPYAPISLYREPPGELILVDTLVLRPLGIAAMGIGLVGSLLSMPFAATSNSADIVGKKLIWEPYDYTFCRRLGDVDYCSNR